MKLHLLPEPKDLMLIKGMFTLDENTLVVIQAEAGHDTLFAARQLKKEIRESTGLALQIVKAYAPPRPTNVVLLAHGPAQAAAFELEPKVGDTPEDATDQGYQLTLRRGRAELYADTSTGLFYAVQTMRQLVRLQGKRLPTLAIRDQPALSYRGLMLDISRRKVPTLATLKHLVAEISHYKLNVLQLYTEHVFQFPRHPKIGAGCGALSSQDILELDAWCQKHHVELMPNLQSFGHARNTLSIPEYQHLAETDMLWTLSPTLEETYHLLDELYGDMLPAFSSPTLNVDCDETYDLGSGASQDLVEKAGGVPEGVGRVYLNHILRVRKLAARYGRRIQVWGDILLHHPELIKEVPEDVTLLDWRYAPLDEYASVWAFARAGRRFWICPGTSSWNSIFPRLYGARINIRNFVRDGVAAGAEGMLNTDWGDSGHYQPLGLSWHGFLFGAAQGWTGGRTEDEAFDAAFGPLFFGPEQEAIMAALHQLARTNDLSGVHRPNQSLTVMALFDDPLAGETVHGEDALPARTLAEMASLAKEAEAVLEGVLRQAAHPRQQTLREMAAAARLTAHAARKTALGQQTRAGLQAIQQGSAAEGMERIYAYILAFRGLERELEALRAEFETLWLARARRSEIHVALGFFSRLRTRYREAISWLEGQRTGLASGVEVDAELKSYRLDGQPILWQIWPD